MSSDNDSKLFSGTVGQALSNDPNAPRPKKNTRITVTRGQIELAVVVLLVELASSDDGFEQKEYNIILQSMTRVFNTNRDTTQRYINQALTILQNLRGTSEYATLLKDHLTSVELNMVGQCIDDVMNADGVQDGFEIYHRRRIRDLLGLENESLAPAPVVEDSWDENDL
jgi:uncharacterized tellurite resistance protein B-like protein